MRQLRIPLAAVLVVVSALVGLEPTPAQAQAGTFTSTVINQAAGSCAEVPDGSPASGAQLQLWDCWGGSMQSFTFIPVSGTADQYTIRTTSGSCVDVSGVSTADDAAIVQWSCHGGTNQRFRLQPVAVDGSTNTFHVIAVHSGKCIAPGGGGIGNGTTLVQLACSTATVRVWRLPGYPEEAAAQFINPVLWQDFADIDIIRVDNTYYYSASTMHYSPGAPILRSYDLVNWEFAGHSVPRLDFGSKYDLAGGRGYVRGIWASTLNYRRSNGTFYWLGCIDFSQTYVYTATSVEGPWQRRSQINNCYFDAGLLIDDNDTMYVAYGNTTINVAQLSADGLSQVRTQQVFQTPPSIGVLEGARFYKRNGSYYIFLTRPANGQYILKSTNGPFGPYEVRQLLLNLPGPIPGGGVPHQGGLVQTQNGDWYYLAFVDSYPGGRVPVLAPISWTTDGWPVLQTVGGAWGTSYPYPNLPPPPRQVRPMIGADTFTGATLGPQWEWNHNPDNSRWSVNNGLRLQTATVTNDLYAARNTLTHRIQGPTSTATIVLNYAAMRDGDRAGLALLRDSSAWIGVRRDGGATRAVMTSGLSMDGNWNTTSTGTEQASAAVSGGRIWLRINADIHPGTGRQGRFFYSTDGVNFTQLGPGFTMTNDWRFFMGYRYGMFNYATQALGGAVTVERFDLTTP